MRSTIFNSSSRWTIRLLASMALFCVWYQSPPSCLAAETTTGSSTSTFTQAIHVRRERNLDHWDSDTLAYYLDHYAGYDVAVMFYAQWDRNSHALAPLWDRVATHLEAGSSSSRLIMSLFDCEWNYQHAELCKALEITHYPTLMFVGAGPYHDSDPITKTILGTKRSTGPMGGTRLPNAVKFQGNWQYGDAIVDWIRTMQALSNWHTWTTEGFGKRLRNFFIPHKTQHEDLPVGIPSKAAASKAAAAAALSSGKGLSGLTSASGSAGSSGGESLADTARLAGLEQNLESLQKQSQMIEQALVHSSLMLDAAIYPIYSPEYGVTGNSNQSKDKLDGDGSKRYTDLFATLHANKGWEASVSPELDIMRTCTLEVSLDYCKRVANHVAEDLVEAMDLASLDNMEKLEQLEKDVLDSIQKKEPYCAILDDCIASGLADDKCRPTKCPFEEDIACRYLTACLDPTMQQDYAEALGVQTASSSAEHTASAAAGGGSQTGGGVWGL